jgi:preprotein translocase subunit SecE
MATEQASSKSLFKNRLLWLLIAIVLVGSLIANYVFPAIPWLIRLIIWLLIALAAFGLFLVTSQGKRFWAFAKAARNELRKVVWPTRAETMQSTLAVAVMVILLALFLWGIDSLWVWLITLITG